MAKKPISKGLNGKGELSIIYLSPEKLKPYDKNPRKNDEAVKAVKTSIEKFGFKQPIVVDKDYVIVVGHTRWKAAKDLMLESVPVHIATDLTPEQIQAYRIADNKTNQLAGWDYDLLLGELEDLKEKGLDLEILGFDSKELSKLFSRDFRFGTCDEDEVPEVQDKSSTLVDTVWEMTSANGCVHRLVCGDASDLSVIGRLLEPIGLVGSVADLAFTDPPYNVNIQARGANPWYKKNKEHRKGKAKEDDLLNDKMDLSKYRELVDVWFANLAVSLKPGGCFYIWGGYTNAGTYQLSLEKNGLYMSQSLIWVKGHPVLGRKDFMLNHEWCYYGWREGAGHHYYGPKNITDIWEVKRVGRGQMVHLTEKPVELAMRAITYSTTPGEVVLDMFTGSGSTLIACEQSQRNFRGLELSPAYCDVIIKRWEDFTGRKARVIRPSVQRTDGPILPGGKSDSGKKTTGHAQKEQKKNGHVPVGHGSKISKKIKVR